MRRRCVLAGVALFGNLVLAQGVPKIEMPVGFSMINAHPDLALIASFNPFGGGEFNVNFDSYFRHFGGTDFALFGDSQVSPTGNCSISPSEIFAGDPILATMTTPNFKADHLIDYGWSTTGGKAPGIGAVTNLDTAGVPPGSYTVTGTATDPREKLNGTVSCSASFTIKTPPPPPTASCSAAPADVTVGQPSTITVSANSSDGRPLTYSYSATAGSIAGSRNIEDLATTGAAAGTTITVTATVADDRHQTASCTAAVNVLAPPPPPAPPVTVAEVQEVGTCNFSDPRKAARVDNVCKALLDGVALQLQREPNGRLVVVGYAEEMELVRASDIDGQRSVNIKNYLTGGEGQAGIDPSRIEARTGPHGSRSAMLYFVPQDASYSGGDTVVVDESKTKGRPRNAP